MCCGSRLRLSADGLCHRRMGAVRRRYSDLVFIRARRGHLPRVRNILQQVSSRAKLLLVFNERL